MHISHTGFDDEERISVRRDRISRREVRSPKAEGDVGEELPKRANVKEGERRLGRLHIWFDLAAEIKGREGGRRLGEIQSLLAYISRTSGSIWPRR